MLAAIERCLGGAAALATLVAGALLTLPALAPAATVAVSEELPQYDHISQLTYVAAPRESNQLSIAASGPENGYFTLELLDPGAVIEAGAGCSGGGAPGIPVLCRLHERIVHELCLKGCPPPQYGENWRVTMQIELGAGDNTFRTAGFTDEDVPIPMYVVAGPGSDRIETGGGADTVDPGSGPDVVRTGAGPDRVATTAAPDGPDLYDLGDDPPGYRGADELSYRDRRAPVIGANGPTGAEGEGDQVFGAEILIGGEGDDQLVGDRGTYRIVGGSGDDELIGGDGWNTIKGDDGDDSIFGNKGRNYLYGGAGDDLLVGGPDYDEIRELRRGDSGDDTARSRGGDDLIVLGPGTDRAYAGRGDDRLLGGPGLDDLGCGPGSDDTVIYPARDRLHACEWVGVVRR